MLALCILASVMRLYDLNTIPPGLWYDEAINGLDALDVLKNGARVFFMTEGHPREPLMIHIIALLFIVFPANAITLRLASAILGILTIPLLYYFVRITTRDAVLAIVSSFFLATIRWHVHFSRVSFRTILVAPVMLLLFVYLFKALNEPRKKRRQLYSILAGWWLGLGMYTYLAFRLVPGILLSFFGYVLLTKHLKSKHLVNIILTILVVAIIISLPMIIDFTIHPEHFSGRVGEVTLFDKGFSQAIQSLIGNAIDVALMFSFKGDHVPKHNIPLKPVFDPLTSFFFYVGIIIALYYSIKKRDPFFTLVLLWLFWILLASVFSFGAPNILRTLGVTPAIAILLALGLLKAFTFSRRYISPRLAWLLLGLILVVFMGVQMRQYFHTWYRDSASWRDFNSNIVDLVDTISSIPENQYRIFIPADLYYHPTFRFLNHHPDVQPAISLKEIVCGNTEYPHFIVATTYGHLMNSGIIDRFLHIKERLQISTYGYGVWALIYVIDTGDLLREEEFNGIMLKNNIDPESIKVTM